MKKKIIIFVLFTFILVFYSTTKIEASYNYAPWRDTIESANSMALETIITSSGLLDVDGNQVNAPFEDLRDSFIYDGFIFVLDAKSNRVYQLNEDFQYINAFPREEHLENEALALIVSLNNPQGIYVKNDLLYVADMDNERVAIFNINTGNLVRQIKKPTNDIFENIPFKPQRLVVDNVGRVILVSKDVYEGIIEFDETGKFTRFFGTNTIQFNFYQSLVYTLSSKKQKEKMSLNLQTPFTSIDIDDYGYIYTVSRNEPTKPVKKMNFKGGDILLNNGYIPVIGDMKYPTWRQRVPLGPSTIVDITANDDNNKFSILDSKRGRIFTYDMEGHLLYIFGGNNINELQSPTSIRYYGEKIIVTDNVNKSLFIYSPTEFGVLINEATKKYYDMDYEGAEELWQQVIELNSNYFLAYAGIGIAQLRKENWKEATKNLKLGHDYYNYSKAYEQYRGEKMAKFVPYLIVGVLMLSAYGLFRSIRTSIKREKGEIE